MLENLNLKRIAFLIIPLAIGGFAVVFFSISSLNKSKNETVVPESALVTKLDDAFVDPNKVIGNEETYEGTIMSVDADIQDSNYQFKLMGNDNKIIAYLLSKGEMLKFVEGQGVIKLIGRIQNKAPDGIDVVYVKSVSLK